MKPCSTVLLLTALIAGLSLPVHGGPPPWAGPGHHNPSENDGDADKLPSLERFLSLTDAQLDQLLQAIGKVRAMTPAERSAMKTQLNEYRKLSPEQRSQVKAGWGWVNETDRLDWQRMMHVKTTAERDAIQQELQSLEPEKRAARKHALLEAWRKAPR